MSEERKQPGVAFWATVVMVCLPLLYALSAGPMLWVAHQDIPGWCLGVICRIYAPVSWAEGHAPDPVVNAIRAYLDWWIPKT